MNCCQGSSRSRVSCSLGFLHEVDRPVSLLDVVVVREVIRPLLRPLEILDVTLDGELDPLAGDLLPGSHVPDVLVRGVLHRSDATHRDHQEDEQEGQASTLIGHSSSS